MIESRPIVIQWDPERDPAYLRQREWLLTNGLGGYASGTLAGMPARRYHGLFVPNLNVPKGRHIMVSRYDESVVTGSGDVLLGGAEYADERYVGESHRHLREFRLDGRLAIWTFDFDGVRLEKTVLLPYGRNTTCVHYRTIGSGKLQLRMQPFVSFRRHDDPPLAVLRAAFTLSGGDGRYEVHLADSPLILRMGLSGQAPAFLPAQRNDMDLFYRIDSDRGDACLESAFSPGYFSVDVEASKPVTFFASTEPWDTLQIDGEALIEAERGRVASLLKLAPTVAEDEFAAQLVVAADQFVVLPASRIEERAAAQAEGSDLRTIYAGYHWFGDWGRDTMISLEGLTLCTGRHREAGAILRTFSNYVRDGLLPNLFPEGERQALYHTVDATLWYFHAIDRYVATTGDSSILTDLFAVLESIVDHHLAGTHFGIHADPADGLITAAAQGYQLTWMDAKVDGWVVTPRRGKPVEIQALWYNALCLMAGWATVLHKPADRYIEIAARVQEHFNARYWNKSTNCLFDVIDGPDGADASIRPNQIFTMSLAHPILNEHHRRSVLQVVRDQLVTPYGLRTLSPGHPDFKAHYRGNLRERDAAYHQGTVWPWLIGHFIDAWMRATGDRVYARKLLAAFPDHLHDAGVGSISEIFDATEPYLPGGCIAQAWSVAEVLRAWIATRPEKN